jgi:glyoxylase-like metal-dependent hydrolase (beta-lactamase superfamily II)/rhodanese-related sulfurtransferase
MYFKQFYLGCLAQASYLIGSEGEAAVVDPRRDVDEYLEEAKAQGLAIRYVIETHLHADFVSGHRELAERTGAEIVFGAKAEAAFPHRAVREGDELRIGKVVLRVLETPGHTPESISVLVIDTEHSPEPRMVLTGDTLFIGDVGRPDLVGARGFTAEAMAEMLHDSLHQKLLRLPDAVEVYPAHGAGSLCGRNISKDTSSTIGEQRRSNYALRPMPRADFIKMMTSDLPEVPQYFPRDVAINREGAPPLAERPLPPALGVSDVERRRELGAVLLDVRPVAAFGAGHVPGSVNIGLGGQFASWAGTLIPADRPLVIVAEEEDHVREAVMRLARVGLDNVAGFLGGGVAAWDHGGRPLATVPQWPVDELRAQMRERGLQVLDVRRPGEYASGHVPGAVCRPLDRLEREAASLDAARPTAVICAGGYRSSAATSLLRRRGFAELYNIVGGTSAWVAAGYEVEIPAESAPRSS